ncbi:cell division protein FtsX [Phaeobacter gallaeciensis]|jgi:cell division transport system permease protein|uniref:cell division protein FtsX n=1 Tax=Phaeobacter gallaeciensis TaxID=60890 RepID=UPI00237F52A4|nr:cell division protein FtsX [Phaeobacter gallaeciensis]MDE4302210.1 cell division protein FtsX [Phaeobacter gallaeciensis]MDE4306813.1 cell division protein FtsX [Phaeobacter gallaeciensis]MDE4311068.1 cell division protein FtsX [Phaeobacter gallaeciensis]MDE4315531.1 cell division protein FtsX [Phaeobacter gallaeciensis]MDE4319995.1 cell division protein FtsX [Phaeobacter gallaeciensis]
MSGDGFGGRLRALISGDAQADRVVPPSGFTAQLTLFAAGAMAFLAVFALALSLASGRLADRWADELARAATLRINAPAEQRAAQTEAALTILRQTPGVASARAFTPEEQAALLAPWFGASVPIDALPVPQLIEVIEDDPGYDATGLRLRLQAEVPGAVLDDHTRWRAPLVDAAQSLRRLAVVSILLIGGAMGAMISLAANAALAANAQVIEVLRLVGAQDSYIAQAFIRRFTLRAFSGAVVGMGFGMLGVWLMPAASDEGGFLTGLGFQGWGWLLPLVIPVLGALVAYVATTRAANKRLGELT